MVQTLTLLGLETSCDDTAAAVVRHGPDGPHVLSSSIIGQEELHASYGGVVPEIAARAHAENIDVCARNALRDAAISLSDLDGIAVTAGPGLIGGLLSGVMFARGLAAGADLPLYPINHLAGHALTPRLTDDLTFPYLILLVSGGHCQFLIVESPVTFRRLGGTIDDAPGEAFDKTARILGLSQPGGPAVEVQATKGDPERFRLPRPLLDRAGCDMSFSGLKTAVLRERDRLVNVQGGLHEQDVSDLCAGFQAAVTDVLCEKTRRAASTANVNVSAVAVAGGVAANRAIRAGLETVCSDAGIPFLAPPLALCTDNAAMIAWAGIERIRSGVFPEDAFSTRPRWPLDQSQPALLGGGRKGAKA